MEGYTEGENLNGQKNKSADDVVNNRGTATVIPVIEEQATVSKKEVETGVVTVTSTVYEKTEPVHMITTHNKVKVEHVPAGYYVDTAPEARWEGDTMIIPVLREEAVVVKKLMLVEEIHITRTQTQTPVTENVTLRKEWIDIKRHTSDGNTENL